MHLALSCCKEAQTWWYDVIGSTLFPSRLPEADILYRTASIQPEELYQLEWPDEPLERDRFDSSYNHTVIDSVTGAVTEQPIYAEYSDAVKQEIIASIARRDSAIETYYTRRVVRTETEDRPELPSEYQNPPPYVIEIAKFSESGSAIAPAVVAESWATELRESDTSPRTEPGFENPSVLIQPDEFFTTTPAYRGNTVSGATTDVGFNGFGAFQSNQHPGGVVEFGVYDDGFGVISIGGSQDISITYFDGGAVSSTLYADGNLLSMDRPDFIAGGASHPLAEVTIIDQDNLQGQHWAWDEADANNYDLLPRIGPAVVDDCKTHFAVYPAVPTSRSTPPLTIDDDPTVGPNEDGTHRQRVFAFYNVETDYSSTAKIVIGELQEETRDWAIYIFQSTDPETGERNYSVTPQSSQVLTMASEQTLVELTVEQDRLMYADGGLLSSGFSGSLSSMYELVNQTLNCWLEILSADKAGGNVGLIYSEMRVVDANFYYNTSSASTTNCETSFDPFSGGSFTQCDVEVTTEERLSYAGGPTPVLPGNGWPLGPSLPLAAGVYPNAYVSGEFFSESWPAPFTEFNTSYTHRPWEELDIEVTHKVLLGGNEVASRLVGSYVQGSVANSVAGTPASRFDHLAPQGPFVNVKALHTAGPGAFVYFERLEGPSEIVPQATSGETIGYRMHLTDAAGEDLWSIDAYGNYDGVPYVEDSSDRYVYVSNLRLPYREDRASEGGFSGDPQVGSQSTAPSATASGEITIGLPSAIVLFGSYLAVDVQFNNSRASDWRVELDYPGGTILLLDGDGNDADAPEQTFQFRLTDDGNEIDRLHRNNFSTRTWAPREAMRALTGMGNGEKITVRSTNLAATTELSPRVRFVMPETASYWMFTREGTGRPLAFDPLGKISDGLLYTRSMIDNGFPFYGNTLASVKNSAKLAAVPEGAGFTNYMIPRSGGHAFV